MLSVVGIAVVVGVVKSGVETEMRQRLGGECFLQAVALTRRETGRTER